MLNLATQLVRWNRWTVLAVGLLALGLAWQAWLVVRIVRFEASPGFDRGDAAVVLGGAVDHGKPSPAFTERIRHAADLYHQGKVRFIIFTGGPRAAGQPAESVAARTLAVEMGVPGSATLLEQRSSTTWENLLYTRPLLEQHNLGTVVIVSDRLHLYRACSMAGRLGIEATPSATPTGRFDHGAPWVAFLARETVACTAYLVQRPLLQNHIPASR